MPKIKSLDEARRMARSKKDGPIDRLATLELIVCLLIEELDSTIEDLRELAAKRTK